MNSVRTLLKSMAHFALLILLVLMMSFWGSAPVNASKNEINRLNARYANLLNEGRFRDAIPIGEKLVALTRKVYGASHVYHAGALHNLANVYLQLNELSEAEKLYKQALETTTRAVGRNNAETATTMISISLLQMRQGRYREAERLIREAVKIRESVLPPDHPDRADSIGKLALITNLLGNKSEAVELGRNSVAAHTRALGEKNWETIQAMRSLADSLQGTGRHDEAIGLYKRAITLLEAIDRREHPNMADTLHHLAAAYMATNRYAEAKPLFERALSLRLKLFGETHPDIGLTLGALAVIAREQGDLPRSERLLRDGLALLERVSGPESPHIVDPLLSLGTLLARRGEFAESESVTRRAVALLARLVGKHHPDTVLAQQNLAVGLANQERFAEAEGLLKEALSNAHGLTGDIDPGIANIHRNLSGLYSRMGLWSAALDNARSAVALFDRRTELGIGTSQEERRSGIDGGARLNLVDAAWTLQNDKAAGTTPTGLIDEAFRTAQGVMRQAADAALGQMAARFSSGSSALAREVRAHQDLLQQWQHLDAALVAAISRPDATPDATAALRREVNAVEDKLQRAAAQLRATFPEYAQLSSPPPLSIAETQQLLVPDEALVLIVSSLKDTYVWAITRDAVLWKKTTGIGLPELHRAVGHLRRGLDLTALAENRGQVFDLVTAHDLYRALIQPVETAIVGHKRLLVVASGPLSGLPFHVLVTRQAAGSKPDAASYASVDWLARRFAVSTLPSVSTLYALRRLAQNSPADRPLIGYGDPVFSSKGAIGQQTGQGAVMTSVDYATVSRGGLADPAVLSAALVPLPDTADELNQIARTLGASKRDIVLGRKATERAVKRAQLERYRIVYFATHGLVAGDVADLAEPALALTVPKTATPEDDGLLTASEIAELKLNANLVVLSACNTASGDRPGAEALSGLARAFFYAGARGLLVSHWPVQSDAAVRLATGMFSEASREPGLSSAEALRRSMVSLMDDANEPLNAYPAIWAPFVVVGDGGALGR